MPFSATRDLWLVLKARDESNRALRSFSTNIRDVGRQVQIAEAISNKADAQRMLRLQRLRGASAAEMQDTKNLIDSYDKQAKAIRVLDMQQEEHRRKSLMLGQQLQGVAAASAAVGLALTAAGIAGIVGIKKLVDVSVEYNRTVALTKTQVDGFQASLKDLSKEGLDVANNIAVPFADIQTTLYDIFSSTNANLKQSKILLDAFAKTAVAGQVSLQDASRGTMAIMNAFHIPLEKVNSVLDIEFQLVRKGVGTYEEFSKVIGRVAPSANRAGQSVETMAAMLAFLTRNGLTAAMSAASAGRALDAFSNPTAVKNLEQLGIKMKGVKGEFLPLADILDQLSAKFSKLTGPERAKAISEIFKGAGGTIQARRFIDQVLKPGEVDRFKGFLKDMQNATGQFGNAYEQMSNTTAAKTQLLSNRWQVMKVTAGNILTPVLLGLVSALGAVLEWFNKLSPSTQKIIVMTLGLGAVFSVVAGIIMFVISGIAAFAAAIAVAGSAVFVTIGAIAGLVAGFGALVTIIALAWRNSSDFRKLIKDIINDFRTWYDEISKSVGPVLEKIGSFLSRVLVPAFKETANIVKTVLYKAFALISDIIKNVVVPAFDWLNKFYERHRSTINSIIPVLKQVAKFLLIVAAVITGVVIVAFASIVLATGAVIAAFFGITIAIVKVIEWIEALVNWFKVEIPKAWSATKDFIIGIWNDIIAGTQLFVTGMTVLIQAGLKILLAIWNAIWGAIRGSVTFELNAIHNAVSNAWHALLNITSFIFNAVKAKIIDIWNSAKNETLTILNLLWSGIKIIWDKITSFFSGIGDKITGPFKDAGKWLYNAGKNIIQGLIDGINSMINRVTDKIRELTQSIRNFFPFSPAKVGPLSGRGNPFYAGQKIGHMLAGGMDSSADRIVRASSRLAGAAAMRMGSTDYIGSTTNGSSGGKAVNQTFNITTQEINPRRHSAELGFELAARL